MALHTELQIYRPAYDLLSLIADLVRQIPRDHKRLLGEKIRDECIEIVTLILRANTARDKAPHLAELLERVQVVELLTRLCRDKRLIAVKHYAAVIELTSSIGKQATGWKKSLPKSPAA
ncbi:four helix bundle protein [Chitiniphilus shinanonensis]|uniref:four helix bundle protein n=1 Tax=Chitiniphilus shinanonensis TaxID=553088 RepID=UPI003024137C